MRTFTRRGALMMPVAALAQTQRLRLTGRWHARMGARQFGGTFTVEPFKEPVDVGGLWQMLNDRGEAVLGGDWSARKRESSWDGGWWGKTSGGAEYTGGWAAKTRLAPGLPLIAMFRSAVRQPISGTWTSDNGRRGTWTVWVDE